MLPNFLIIGAQKAGTTWLAERLSQHPEIFVAPREIHFFDKADRYARGLAWYEAQFAAASSEKAVGEKTPDYLWANGRGVEGHLPDVHRNIHAALPHARLIVSLRNPVERAISAAHHIIRSGRIPPHIDIDDLLLGDQRHLLEGHGVLDYGFYHRQIQAYLELFPREQMLILIFEEDLAARPEKGLRAVCEFLGVDADFPFRDAHRKSNVNRHSLPRLRLNRHLPPRLRPLTRPVDWLFPPYRPRPPADTLAALYDLYADSNAALFKFLQRPLPLSWRPASDQSKNG